MDRKVKMMRTGRSLRVEPEGLPGLGWKSPETHGPEGRVEYGLERLMCVSGILGNSLSFLLTVFMRNVFQVLVKITKRRRHDLYTLMKIYVLEILGWFIEIICDTMGFEIVLMKFIMIENEKLFENSRCYKLVSEPWFEGFGCTCEHI